MCAKLLLQKVRCSKEAYTYVHYKYTAYYYTILTYTKSFLHLSFLHTLDIYSIEILNATLFFLSLFRCTLTTSMAYSSSSFVAVIFVTLLLAPALTLEESVNDTEDHGHDHDHELEHEQHEEEEGERNELGLWLAASGAIVVISLCGVFGVLVIPIMQKVMYQYLIQFLIALAIGTLSGDALLHLYPHALLADFDKKHRHSSEHDENFHIESVWKGFAGKYEYNFFFSFCARYGTHF